MGSRGFGAASRRNNKGRLGSVSDYCVHHCICPVIVVRYDQEGESEGGIEKQVGVVGDKIDLHPVPEEEQEYHDASEEPKDGMESLSLVTNSRK